MKVKPKEEILHKGVWYRPGEELPADYLPKKEANEKPKTVRFKKKDEVA